MKKKLYERTRLYNVRYWKNSTVKAESVETPRHQRENSNFSIVHSGHSRLSQRTLDKPTTGIILQSRTPSAAVPGHYGHRHQALGKSRKPCVSSSCHNMQHCWQQLHFLHAILNTRESWQKLTIGLLATVSM